jgi:FkbM family methyltransferase
MPRTRVAQVRDASKVMLTRFPRAYDSMRRPYAAARFWLRRPHDPDYAAFGLFPDRQGEFLDVGANAGMSALSFRIYNRTSAIVSVEPNPFHERDLDFVSRLAKPLTYHMWAAGRERGTLTLYVPRYRDVALTTEASPIHDEVVNSGSLRARLGDRMDSSAFEIASHEVPVRPLDSLELSPDFIKLDVEGFEYEVLLGLRETVLRSYPIMMIETPDDNVRRYLHELGYTALIYSRSEHRLVPERDLRSNVIFVPHTVTGTGAVLR